MQMHFAAWAVLLRGGPSCTSKGLSRRNCSSVIIRGSGTGKVRQEGNARVRPGCTALHYTALHCTGQHMVHAALHGWHGYGGVGGFGVCLGWWVWGGENGMVGMVWWVWGGGCGVVGMGW